MLRKLVNPTYLTALLLIGLFLFLRFYNITNSLFFFNDMGRDALVLQQWHDTGKPPILGPQTSALPFNQSALYFYLLYPAFVLTGQSPLSALLTNAVLYISSFLLGLYLLARHPEIQKRVLLVFFLLSIHPQYIIQSRYIWNPSFVTPFLVAALISLFLVTKHYSLRLLWLFGLSLAIALSLSFSVAPLFIVLSLYSGYVFRRHLIALSTVFLTSLALANLPTLLFELKHKFLLTQAVISQKTPPQADIDLASKIRNLGNFGLVSPTQSLNSIIMAVIFGSLLFYFLKSKNNHTRQTAGLLLATLIVTLIIPVTVQAHYIFGLLVLLFIFISTLPSLIRFGFIMVFLFLSFRPTILKSYFSPATRTYSQMENCFKNFCQHHPERLFVSVQSNLHPYHFGPEHRYLLKKQGCHVAAIETDPSQTQYMAVVNDGGEYNHGVSQYYELDLFGPSTVIDTQECLPQFKIYLLEKNIPTSQKH